MWLEAIREPEDHASKCPTCGGHVRRRPYGALHAGTQVLDGQRVEIRKRPSAGFADPIVLDPLVQYFDGGLYRLWPKERYYARGGKRLHRDVWEAAFGPIPAGHHIHHRDGNPSHNAVANLELLPASQHLADSWKKRADKHSEHFSAAARARAAEWHASEVGRAWHRRHAKRSKGWTKWKRVAKPCEHCGTVIQALVRAGNSQKFCTDTCKALAYRLRRAASRKV
jgi:endogenous inhibitor of DNA gyrase (YacG/DUF329 family)